MTEQSGLPQKNWQKNGFKTSNTAIANWEKGLNKPDADTISALCDILGKDGNYFFDFDSTSNNNLDTDGLDEKDIEELNRFIEFLKNNQQMELHKAVEGKNK